jgi:hypothetical protein
MLPGALVSGLDIAHPDTFVLASTGSSAIRSGIIQRKACA